ncbi:M23 family metallopeptidase [Polaribacter gangjinensis]|uniref:Peptidase M23 n=1 Tax=Polaribacter gangjinensis TaxID=574710 RepID=A0A2S7W8A2_9FLAO|nr:M23 family metallopeptidase [Polaribacter gangjinensis]PQJ73865.1 peptidase M23 [Polaribacter gangjinensis]
MIVRFFLFYLLVFLYAEELKRPSFISFEIKKDSINVILKNPVLGNTFLKITNHKTKKEQFLDFKKPDTLTILTFPLSKTDTISIIKNYSFNLYYGPSNLSSYDTLYNYNLPFLKGKRYKVLQGQNTNFTHKGNFSKYAIDFKMNIGQTVCAIRDGLVIHVKENSGKGGNNKKFFNDANYILVAHSDGTYSQYVHLKKDGAIVSKGDFVKKGQPIGYSGNTGMSTEPHLHFGVFKPTKTGFYSIPFILNAIPSSQYKKGKFANNQ